MGKLPFNNRLAMPGRAEYFFFTCPCGPDTVAAAFMTGLKRPMKWCAGLREP